MYRSCSKANHQVLSYVEKNSKAWMDRSLVGRRKESNNVVVLQQLIKMIGAEVRVFPIGVSYCYISFGSVESMETYRRYRMLEKWFSEIRKWEESDLANFSVCWICLKGVPIPMQHAQFFSFAVTGIFWKHRRRRRRSSIYLKLG